MNELSQLGLSLLQDFRQWMDAMTLEDADSWQEVDFEAIAEIHTDLTQLAQVEAGWIELEQWLTSGTEAPDWQTETLRDSEPASLQGSRSSPSPVPELHSPAPELHSSVPELHLSAPELHSSARLSQSSVPELHSPAPELHSPTRSSPSPVPELHLPVPELHLPTRSSQSPAPEWNSGLTVRSQLKLTKDAEIGSQSPSADFVQLAPNSIPGRDSAMSETPNIAPMTPNLQSEETRHLNQNIKTGLVSKPRSHQFIQAAIKDDSEQTEPERFLETYQTVSSPAKTQSLKELAITLNQHSIDSLLESSVSNEDRLIDSSQDLLSSNSEQKPRSIKPTISTNAAPIPNWNSDENEKTIHLLQSSSENQSIDESNHSIEQFQNRSWHLPASQHFHRRLEQIPHSDRASPIPNHSQSESIELDDVALEHILAAVEQQVNQEYIRFYGQS